MLGTGYPTKAEIFHANRRSAEAFHNKTLPSGLIISIATGTALITANNSSLVRCKLDSASPLSLISMHTPSARTIPPTVE